MDIPDSWREAAHDLVASAPPPKPESMRALKAQLRALRASADARQPDAIAKREPPRGPHADMNLTFERYLRGEISLESLYRRLLIRRARSTD